MGWCRVSKKEQSLGSSISYLPILCVCQIMPKQYQQAASAGWRGGRSLITVIVTTEMSQYSQCFCNPTSSSCKRRSPDGRSRHTSKSLSPGCRQSSPIPYSPGPPSGGASTGAGVAPYI
ncbi:hypothetical protein PoB_006617800 [Plakobranchus ocellatus]|uniref:Uncharacterized protein n=1 Tax=Plakobranchus ocellatus TaxID=259542 RepID=A0AAV4D638_9GAST|nr:hypothetical protein PoB_006617800 [Plakobranchus ocellatus]